MAWQPIATAPKDGTEILGWREDCGTFIMRFASAVEFMTTIEIESSQLDDDALHEPDWFAADFIQGCRLEGDEVPAIWMKLPEPATGEISDDVPCTECGVVGANPDCWYCCELGTVTITEKEDV